MRILFACEFYHPSVGGVQEVMRQVAERLVARGHSVTVATSYLAERQERQLNGVKIAEFKVSGNWVRGLSGDTDGYREYVLQGDYDVFMVKAAQQWTFDALIPVLGQMVKPKVFIPCGFSGLFDPAYAAYFRMMPEALREFDHLIFYASGYRDIDFARDHGLREFSIVPNGASEREFSVPRDPGFRQRHRIAEGAFVVLTVGTFTGDLKGHRELAQAFAVAPISREPAVLILNGNNQVDSASGRFGRIRPMARELRRVAHALAAGLSPKARFRARTKESVASLVSRINDAGPAKQAMIVDLPRAELVQAYLNSDLFVFASRVEYSPLVLYEAAAAGLPFLTVPVGNAAEIAQWTGAGLLCPATLDDRGYTNVDPVVLAEHMCRLIDDADLRTALGQAGHEAWLERFTWERIADAYETLLDRLAGRAAA